MKAPKNVKNIKKLNKATAIKIAAAALAILVLVLVIRAFAGKDRNDQSEKIEQGISYLEALEAKDPNVMLEELRQKRRDEQATQIEEILAKIDSGEISVWSQFRDAAILGDSRAEDFVFDGFLTTANVYAEKGTMCTDAMDYLDAVAATNPSRLFFTYGMNDVDGYWNTSEDFIEAYKKVINAYRERMPNAVVFVNSIIPVNAHAIENDSNYENIPEYNEKMKAMAESLGVCWIDCDNFYNEYPQLYDTDGQHFFPDMYPIWAKTMLKAAFDYEYANNADADVLSEVEAAQKAADAESQAAAAAESTDGTEAGDAAAEQADATDGETGDGTDGETDDGTDGEAETEG